ncbi:hypothetical protein [Phytohabitans kaempferiae]|uniref:Uncharacterized protein n=1 Tax=Phytohabitans kaempferiae TaxID=1620943 RepID=A0ABV6MCN9_9ACTN
MATTVDLVARSGDLKRELVQYTQQPRYDRALREALLARDLPPTVSEEQQWIMFLDYFVLQHRLPNGKTVVEQFVAAHPDLPEAERDLLLGWRDVVEGVFEVKRRDGDALVVENLIDDLTYRVYSNMGPAVFRRMPRRSFVITRLVPIGADWLISGMTNVFPAGQRAHVHQAAAGVALRNPALIFRNPDKLARGWELQRAERDRFVRFFGTDLVVLSGEQFADQMRQYQEFSRKEILAALPEADRTRRADSPAPEFATDPHLLESETVAIIFDEVEGLNFYAEFGLVEAVFADPALLRRRLYKQRLIDYLDDESVSPLPFRRLADRDLDRASVLFQKLLRRPGFDWRRDGEELLRERKASFFERPPQPSFSPISEHLAGYVSRG